MCNSTIGFGSIKSYTNCRTFQEEPPTMWAQFRTTHIKSELRISDFQHFHWVAGHRLSVHTCRKMVFLSFLSSARWYHFHSKIITARFEAQTIWKFQKCCRNAELRFRCRRRYPLLTLPTFTSYQDTTSYCMFAWYCCYQHSFAFHRHKSVCTLSIPGRLKWIRGSKISCFESGLKGALST